MGLFDKTLRMRESAAEFMNPEPLVASAPRPLTASAEKINLKSSADVLRLRNRAYTDWQNDAWAYYDAIGEIKYAFTMASNVISRIRLYPAINFEQDAVPTSIDTYKDKMHGATKAEEAVEAAKSQATPKGLTDEVLDYAEKLVRQLLHSGPGGASGFMRAYALNILVAGECFLVNIRGVWTIRSSSEVVDNNSGQIVLRTQRSGPSANGLGMIEGDIPVPKGAFMTRIWREHPRYSGEPDSSMLSIREICDEVISLQRWIRSVARSRMNAGLLFIPDGLTAAGSTVTEDMINSEHEMDALTTALYESITAPIADETNAASVVPTIITGPGAEAANIKYIPIERSTDQWLVAQLEAAMGRILGGLDVPKDMVEGMTGMRYSNAKVMSDHMYQAQIEPMTLMLCDALSHVYLRPMLKKQFPHLTPSDLDLMCIWYDPSEVVTKSDPTASADKGHENFAISDDVWRRSHGYSDSDAPNEQELARRYLLSKAPPQPGMIDMMFKQAFPGTVENARNANLTNAPVPMPESAQKILYGEVVVPPEENTSRSDQTPPEEDKGVATLPEGAAQDPAPTGGPTGDGTVQEDLTDYSDADDDGGDPPPKYDDDDGGD